MESSARSQWAARLESKRQARHGKGVGAWHTTESRVYRDDTACTEGNNIEPKNRRQGTGAKDKWPMSVVSLPAIVSRGQL